MLLIKYNTKHVHGQILSQKETYEQPIVSFMHYPRKMYTLIMVDLDALYPEYLHWMIVNSTSIIAEVMYSYQPPTPSSNSHRYYFYLYEQQNHIYPSQTQHRSGFSTKDFVNKFNLKLIDELFFIVQA